MDAAAPRRVGADFGEPLGRGLTDRGVELRVGLEDRLFRLELRAVGGGGGARRAVRHLAEGVDQRLPGLDPAHAGGVELEHAEREVDALGLLAAGVLLDLSAEVSGDGPLQLEVGAAREPAHRLRRGDAVHEYVVADEPAEQVPAQPRVPVREARAAPEASVKRRHHRPRPRRARG